VKKLLLAVVVLMLWTAGHAAQSRPQDLALQDARRSAAVGNLKDAVAQFKTIIATYPDDRSTKAAALLGLGDAYRRLGDAESQKIYALLAAEYADQREVAALARARLAPGESGTEPHRRVWTVPVDADLSSRVSFDGRYVAYVDWSTAGKGDLFLHAFGGGADRRLTRTDNKENTTWKRYAGHAAISRDGRSVAYAWVDDESEQYELRIVPLTGTAAPQPKARVALRQPSWIDPYDWTPDGKWIAAMWKTEGSAIRIGMVSTADGSLRELKAIDRPCACAMRPMLSPNGRYLAYDIPGKDTKARDVYVIDVVTAVEYPAVVYTGHDALIGWSPDGHALIISSDRMRPGTDSLWSAPFAEGKTGQAKLIRSEPGPFSGSGVTESGAVFYCRCEPAGGSDIKIATFDFTTGMFLAPPIDAVQQFVGTNSQPFWSPNGQSFLYRSIRPNQDPMIAIQDLATGEVRELRPHQVTLGDPRWAPDGKSIAVLARDFNDAFGYRRLDVATGAITPIITYPRGISIGPVEPGTSWSRDGSKVFFRRYILNGDPEGLYVEVDVATGQERVIVRRRAARDTLFLQLSPDHRTLYYLRPIEESGLAALVARDMTSGAERELIRRDRLGNFNISPDGRWLGVGLAPSATDPAHVLLVPTAGGDPIDLHRGAANQTTGATNLLSMGPGIWAPDSQSLILRLNGAGANDQPEFWWVPLDKRAPRKLVEFNGLNPAGLRLHPDGHRILFGAKPVGLDAPKPTEFWVLEGLIK